MTHNKVNDHADNVVMHTQAKNPGMSRNLLIPVDFSDASLSAVKVGFHFAQLLGLSPVILHVYPMVWASSPFFDQYIGVYTPDDDELLEAEEAHDIQRIAECQLDKFRKKLRERQTDGNIPDVPFSTSLLPGIPEDVILDYCRENAPRLVVMATRGIDKKEEDLIGSVTAEVLDSCRVPVFTVPDNYPIAADPSIKRVLMLCTLEAYDVAGLDNMMTTFDTPDIELWLMPMARNNPEVVVDKLKKFREKICDKWPGMSVRVADSIYAEVDKSIDDFISDKGIQLVIAPNRKTSIFTRLFRPSVAHQCIFTIDIPMLAIPVSKA